MSTTINNLALPIVKQKIGKILETYPNHPHQQAFSNPELRQRLTAYVMSEIDCKFTVSEAGQQPQVSAETLFPSTEEQAHLEASIHQGIERLLQKGNWVEHSISEKETKEPNSHWFG